MSLFSVRSAGIALAGTGALHTGGRQSAAASSASGSSGSTRSRRSRAG